MMTDPIADFLIQIKNGYLAEKQTVTLPHSMIKEQLAQLLVREGYLASAKVIDHPDSSFKDVTMNLLYENKTPSMEAVVRMSKPGRRWYVDARSIPVVLNGLGIVILSTSQGIMTGKEAKKRGVGGEVICKIW